MASEVTHGSGHRDFQASLLGLDSASQVLHRWGRETFLSASGP